MLKGFKNFFNELAASLFKGRKSVKLGLYGPPNSGKCVTPETEIVLQNGEIKQIKDIFNEARDKKSQFKNFDEFNEVYIDSRDMNLIVPSFDMNTLKIVPKKVSFVYAQKYKGIVYRIKTKTGRVIRTTPEHPLITISDNGVEKVKSSMLKEGSCIAITKNLSLNSNLILSRVCEGFNINSNGTIQSTSRFHYPKEITAPSYIDEDLVNFIGYTLSESYHTKSRIIFSNSDKNSLNHFEYLTKKLFNLDCIKRVNKGVPEREINSKTLTDYLSKVLNFNPNTSESKEIPDQLMGMPDNLTASLLRTLFDMEGFVPKLTKNSGAEIEFCSKSKKLVEQVQLLLNRFCIVGRFKEKIVNNQKYHRFFIAGSDSHRKFREKIGFNIKYKSDRLNNLCKCGLKRNKFYLPIVNLLDDIRKKDGLSQREFFLDKKHVSRMGRENRITYHRIENMAKINNNELLNKLANSDNLWDEISDIKEENYDGYVYDLTVENTHTFLVSNGLIASNTTIANRICQDWLGEEMGKVSKIPHETREVHVKEKVTIKNRGREVKFNLVDTPGIATKIDYEDFLKFKMNPNEAKKRAKEATKGVIEAIRWLDNMDCVLVVLDSTLNPYSQVNITIIGNLAARNTKVLIVGNKTDLKKADLKKIESAFPQYKVVGVSAEKGHNMEELYREIFKLVR